MRPRIDHGDVSAGLAGDVSARAIRQKSNGTRPTAGIDFCDYALLVGIDREHFAFVFAGHIHFAVCWVYTDAFRLIRNFYLAARLPRAEIDNRGAGVVFVCDECESSIFADCELLRVRPDMPAIGQLARCCVDHTKAISSFVCRRAIFLHTGRHSWRTAQCHKNSLAVRRGVNATRTFAYRKTRNHAIRCPVNDCDVARSFITDKH